MSRPDAASLPERFRTELARLGVGQRPEHLLVAVSGGCDSVVLLHLLRSCAPELPLRLTAAHLDHAMRAESAADALWVEGLCREWGVELVSAGLSVPPAGEDAARRARHAFLRREARAVGAGRIVLGHHADDQAETVLFRALRGTGLRGLAGMAPATASGLLRPLLGFWREEIESFARSSGLRWREDSSNTALDATRNRIRHELLPLAERRVAPGTRRSLVSLAELARRAEAALLAAAQEAEGEIATEEGGAVLLARGRLQDYDSEVASRIVRNVLRRFGVVLGRPGTRTALQFITRAPSGRELQLPHGVRVRTEFGWARVERHLEAAPDEPLRIDRADGASGQGRARIGGRERVCEWRFGGWSGESSLPTTVLLPVPGVRFPLWLRGWQAGDRMLTRGGTKTLRKLFQEARVPRSRRTAASVVADASGSVLWVAGVGRADLPLAGPGDEVLFLTVSDA